MLLRLLGRLDEAYEVANEAVRQARFTGDREQLLGARIRPRWPNLTDGSRERAGAAGTVTDR